jgi:uncharacterized protein
LTDLLVRIDSVDFLTPETIFSSLSWLLIFLGLVGAIIPVLPGPILIFAGALIYAINSGFEQVGIPTLVVLALLTALAWGSELMLTTYFTKRAGASWRTVAGAIIGGLVGGLLLTPLLPLIGTLFGAATGAVLGVLFVELKLNNRDRETALRISRNYLTGCLLGRVVELTLCVLMIGIFAFQALA